MARKDKTARRYCKKCNSKFTPVRVWQIFCCGGCRNEWHCEEIEEAKALLREKRGGHDVIEIFDEETGTVKESRHD